MCVSSTGYCQQFTLYTEKVDSNSEHPSQEAVVTELTAPYLLKGYILYVVPTLFHRLLKAGTNVLGTVRLHQKQMSQDLKDVKLKKGIFVAW
jgi:hypothetical protein